MSYYSYGKSVGEIMKKTAEDVFASQSQEDFYARANVEQTEFHGDPAIKMNTQPKADYVIEDQMVKVSPGFISVADASFNIDGKYLNLGKAPQATIVIEVKRRFPNQTEAIVFRDTVAAAKYSSTISVKIPIDPIHDKGLNKLTITVDADGAVDEMFETNNSITKEFMIYEDEARPVYPYNFAIINKSKDTLVASTADPFSPSKEYRMELDTTELFNSPAKIVKSVTSAGGVLKFDPGISFTDGTVYYWRVAPVPESGPFTWNTASFIYLANSEVGFNQSHLYQHFKSEGKMLELDSTSQIWSFGNHSHSLFVRNTMYNYGGTQESDFTISVDGDPYIRSACVGRSLVFNVFDAKTFKPWKNVDANGNSLFRYGSGSASCNSGRQYNFEFSYMTPASRKQIMDFMDSIPAGAYVVVRSMDFSDPNSFSATWRGDTTMFGSNKSLYHKLLAAGFAGIDEVNSPRCWSFMYQKGSNGIAPKYVVAADLYAKTTLTQDVLIKDNSGMLSSPEFGPAKTWKTFSWQGNTIDAPSEDAASIDILGVKKDGSVDTLFSKLSSSQTSLDISSINAIKYPQLQIRMHNQDTLNNTPYQLKYWRLTYDPAPEGAVAPNSFFSMKDTVDVAEPLEFKMAFKNVSKTAFADSITIKAIVTDQNNVTHVLPLWKTRSLSTQPDTLHVTFPVDTRQLVGSNSLYVEVNPDNAQPEQYHFNNFFYKSFYVRPDTLNPLMDVTFDNVHILNNDIVSANPDIMIKLKDESKWFLMDDTSTVNVQVRFPDNSLRNYAYDGTTLTYTAPQQAPSTNNTATINVKPTFDQDGEYELLVAGRDMSKNRTGNLQYRVTFQVYNKHMISNMLNYPNPFTTSTAFVFTITGSQVPQNLKIQILTVTGKVIREITKEELGPIHIGRNITDFKWDGTDQYGQKLGNGVYLYRVVSNLNGKSLDKFESENAQTDKIFNKGYGKMYLMR
jgi:flagellar hook assembly protein FlgD